MYSFRFAALAVLALAGLSAACTRSVQLGADFLDDEKSLLQYSEAFALDLHTEKTDSILVHSDNVSLQLPFYLLGQVEDPVFGRYTAELFAQPVLPTVATELIGATLDSVVLALRYDTIGLYGDWGNEPVTLTVYQMAENPAFDVEVYSNHRFLTNPDPLGSVTFTPRPLDTLTVNVPDTVQVPPQIRIPLDRIKVRDILLQDSVVFENQDSFLNYFKGLHIRMTSGSKTMLGINLLNAASGLFFYYDKDTQEDQAFQFVFTSGSIKTLYLEHDYAGSPVEDALSPEPETSYWYIQGMSGPTTRLSVSGLEALGNVGINQAELEFYATVPDEENRDLYPPCPYLVTQEKTDTSLALTYDVTIALNRATGSYSSVTFATLFGGNAGKPDPGPPVVYAYKMIVTDLVQELYKAARTGGEQKTIYLNPIVKGIFPHRAVLFGPDHPLYAPKLRVYYTEL